METKDSNGTASHRERGRGRRVFWLALGAVAIVIVLAIVDGGPRDRGGLASVDSWNQRIEHAFDYLDLTAEQEAQIRPVLAELEVAGAQLAVEHARVEAELESVLRAGDIEAAQVEELRSDLGQLADDAIDVVFTALTRSWLVLSPEQRAEMLDHWQRRRSRTL